MSGPTHHETSDANFPGILAFAGALLAAGIVIHALVWLLFLFFSSRAAQHEPAEFPLAAGQAQRVPPEPRLQTDPREDLRTLRQAEDQALQTYGWVDRTGGVVRIPIDEAMKLTVERGLPSRAPNEPSR